MLNKKMALMRTGVIPTQQIRIKIPGRDPIIIWMSAENLLMPERYGIKKVTSHIFQFFERIWL